jgi:hypothetical protein
VTRRAFVTVSGRDNSKLLPLYLELGGYVVCYEECQEAHSFGTGHDVEGTKFILEKTEELQVRGFVLKKFVKIYVNKLQENFITIKLLSLNSSFVQCCETRTLGTVTFCLSGIGPITVSVPEPQREPDV